MLIGRKSSIAGRTGSETTGRIVKVDQYAKAGIGFYRRIEQGATGVPLVYTPWRSTSAGSDHALLSSRQRVSDA